MSTNNASKPINISATSARRQFGRVVQRTYSGEEHFVVEKDGLPVVAIISMPEYQEFLKNRQVEHFRTSARAFGEFVEERGLTEDDADNMIEASRQRLHEQRHGE